MVKSLFKDVSYGWLASQAKVVACALVLLGSVSCSSSGNQSSNVSGSIENKVVVNGLSGVSIDSTSLFPIPGKFASGVVDVHNDSNKSCKLTVSAASNNPYVVASIDSNTNDQIINPNNEVSIGFSLAVMDGADVLSAQYGALWLSGSCTSTDGDAILLSQHIDFASISPGGGSGVIAMPGLNLYSNAKDKKADGDLYIYCANADAVGDYCNIDGVSTTSFQIENGNPTHRDLAVGVVSRIELSHPATARGMSDKVSVTSHISGMNQLSSVNVGVSPANSGTITTPHLPLINSAISVSESFVVSNPTNTPVTLSSITAAAGIVLTSGPSLCSSASTIQGHGSCIIYFSVPSGSNGSGNILLSYKDATGSTVTNAVNVTYYNGDGTGVVVGVAGANSTNFTTGQTGLVVMTLTNLGSVPVTLGSNAVGVTQSAPALANTDGACNGIILQARGQNSCTTQLSINSSSAASGYVWLTISGLYFNALGVQTSYSRAYVVNFTVTPSLPNIILSQAPVTMSITANGVATQSQTLTLMNAGTSVVSANIQSVTLANAPSYLVTNADSCTTLNADESCSITLSFGPTSMVQPLTSAHLVVNYNYASGSGVLDESIPYEVTPESENLVITAVTAPSSVSGDGSSVATELNFSGSNTTLQTVELQLQNQGSSPVVLGQFFDSSSPVVWSLERPVISGNDCYPGESLAVDATCNFVYDNVLPQNILAIGPNSTGTYMSSITVPQISYVSASGNRFLQQPPITLPTYSSSLENVYVQNNFATVSTLLTTVAPAVSAPVGLNIRSILTNATGYSSISVLSNLEDYFLPGIESVSSTSCVSNASDGVRNQSCNFIGNSSASVMYDMNSFYLANGWLLINATGSVAANSQTVAFSQPAHISINMGFQLIESYVGGAATANQLGNYVAIGTPGGYPGARQNVMYWTDKSGNFWLFGGAGYGTTSTAGQLNDLWKYNPSTNQWTWVSGSSTINQANTVSNPGSRISGMSWTDNSGNLWLYSGQSITAGQLNDLWKYIIGTGWTQVKNYATMNGVYGVLGTASASNYPSARQNGVTWTDKNGNLWLFGGFGSSSTSAVAYLNDLWMYNGSQWIWQGGANSTNQIGSYGTVGVAGGYPGARQFANRWIDNNGNLWLFGGFGYGSISSTGDLNDLWMYNTTTKAWTWMGGSSGKNQAATYGPIGYPAANYNPGARRGAFTWTDNSGNLWLFGGYFGSSGGNLNDVWKYNISIKQWTYEGGSVLINQFGVYSAGGLAGGRSSGSAAWKDSSGRLWFFGGFGLASSGASGYLNDLWNIGVAY